VSLDFEHFGEMIQDNPTTGDVVQWMCRFAWDAHKNKDIRDLTTGIVSGVQSGDYASEAAAIYNFVLWNVRYVRDTVGMERVVWPLETLKQRSGDCDDMATTIAGMMQSIGATCSFVLASFTPSRIPSHVFCRVETPEGPIVLDPVAGVDTRKMLMEMTDFMVIPCSAGAEPESIKPVGRLAAPFHGWAGWGRR
jgi:hypothetical protein